MYPHLDIYFGSPVGRYPTFYTPTSVRRIKLLSMSETVAAFRAVIPTDYLDAKRVAFKNFWSMQVNNRALELMVYASLALMIISDRSQQTRTYCFITGRSAGHDGNSCTHATKASRILKTFQFSSNLKINYLHSEIVL